VPVWAISNKD